MPEGIAGLDNAFGTVSDPAAVQRICDGLTGQKIYRFAGKWLARLPQPFTRADEDAGYRWQLPGGQAEFSATMALDRPLAGRIFSGQLIRDNPDIGRPDKVNIVFGRTIRQRGKFRTPGTFRTQVITNGTCPYLYLDLSCKKTQDGQYLKEGRALRTETTVNQPRDLGIGIGKELTNLAATAKAGYTASRRLLDAGCISHDPAAETAAPEMLTSPVISTTCTRVPGMRFPDPRVQALLAACCALALRPAGFTLEEVRVVVGEAHAAGLPVTAHAHGLPAVHMAMAAGANGIEHCSFLTDKGPSQSEEPCPAGRGAAVCPTPGMAGTPEPTPNAAALLAKLGMTFEQVMEMNKRRVGQMHAAGGASWPARTAASPPPSRTACCPSRWLSWSRAA